MPQMVDNSNERLGEPLSADQTSCDVIPANNPDAIPALVVPLTLESVLYEMIFNKTFLNPVCERCYRNIAKSLVEECGADIDIDYCDSKESVSPMRREFISKYGVLIVELLIRRRAVVWDNEPDISCIHSLLRNKYYLLLYIRMLNDEGVNQQHIDTAMLRGTAFVGIVSRYACHHFGQIRNKIDFLKAAATGDTNHMKAFVAEDIADKTNAIYLAMLNGQVNAETFLFKHKQINLKDYVNELEVCGAKLIIFWAEKDKGLKCWRKSVKIKRVFRIGLSGKNRIKTKMDLGIEFQTNEDINLLARNDNGDCYIQGLLIFLRHFSSSNKLTQSAFEVVAEHHLFNDDLFLPLKIISELFYFPHRHIGPPSQRALHAMEKLFHYRFSRYIEDKTAFLNRFQTLFEQLNNRIWNYLFSVSVDFHRASYEELLALVVMNIDYMSAYDLNIEEKNSIGKEITKLVKTCTPPYATTLLHKAIKMKSLLPVVSFIIEHTYDVNCRDASNRTPLHLVARFKKWDPYLHYMANVLIEAGGHIDCVDSSGERPLEALKRKGVIRNPLDNLSLQCLAAEVISKSEIFVSEKTFPKILVRFIRLHSKSRYETNYKHKQKLPRC